MKFSYLVFNLIILLSPVFSYFFYSKIIFPNKINHFLAIIFSSLLFIFHDIKVNNRWWCFNRKYITGIKIFNLPFEEVLFFFTVSFSCLTIWLNLKTLFNQNFVLLNVFFFGSIFILFFIIFLKTKKVYTKFVNCFYFFLIFLDLFFEVNLILRFNFLIFSLIVILLTLVFNFYLTKKPVVIYNKNYLSNLKILTIPLEDFLYGINLTYLLVLITEFLSKFSIFSK